MVTLAEWELYCAARDGDFTRLIEMLRSGAELSPEARNLLADILDGKLKHPKHRPPRSDTHHRHLLIADRVRELARDRPLKAAKLDVAKEFKCDDRTVATSIRKLREYERRFGRWDPDPLRELNDLKRALGIKDEKK